MAPSRLDVVAFDFHSEAELLHEKFLTIRSDVACSGCNSSGYGEAILTAWLQTKWGDFSHALVIASALGTRRKKGNLVKPARGVRSQGDAAKLVNKAVECVIEAQGFPYPVWHSPSFVIEVSTIAGLKNMRNIENALGATDVPEQITNFRNYLVHPNRGTRTKYERLQAKLGMLRTEPEDLLHRHTKPGLTVFTSWVRELQNIAFTTTV